MYPRDWLASRRVRRMNDFQRGWYIQLLNEAWNSERQCYLPDDDEELQFLAGVSDLARGQHLFNTWWSFVRGMFEQEDGMLFNQKQLDVWNELMDHRAKKSEAGKASARARADKAKHQDLDTSTGVEQVLKSVGTESNSASASASSSAPAPAKVEEKTIAQPKTVSQPHDLGFEQFWQAYPKRKSKQAAFKAWKKLRPSQELQRKILSAIASQKESEGWKKERGQFIPYPATWLNAGGWDDEMQEAEIPWYMQEKYRNAT